MNFENLQLESAFTESEAALAAAMDPSQIVTRAGTMLEMVEQGLNDMRETERNRVLFGFLGLVVFGRSMTFVMQNLRRYDKEEFDSWYIPWQLEMEGDPLMCYFKKLRTMVIHQDSPAIAILLYSFRGTAPIGSITIDGLKFPSHHLNQPINDTSMLNLCHLYIAYLERMFESFAIIGNAVHDRVTATAGLGAF